MWPEIAAVPPKLRATTCPTTQSQALRQPPGWRASAAAHGRPNAAIATAAADAGLAPDRIFVVPDAASALEVLRPRLRDGDVVLVKASRAVGLDRLADALVQEREPVA